MSNRAIPIIYYLVENHDDSVVLVDSSKNSSAFQRLHQSKIGKDVVATNHLNYVKLTPTADGCDWVSVQCLDLDVAGVLKSTVASRQASSAMHFIQVIKTKKSPT